MCLESWYYLAGIISAFTAIFGLFGLAYYAYETRRLRTAAQEQIENMMKPCVLFVQNFEDTGGFDERPLLIKNFGTGTAINIRWRTAKQEGDRWHESPALAVGEIRRSPLRIKDVLNSGSTLTCEFESLSGTRYATTSSITDSTTDFDPRHSFLRLGKKS